MRRFTSAVFLLPAMVLLFAGCATLGATTDGDDEAEVTRTDRRIADYSQWDQNGDGVLSESEFRTLMSDDQTFQRYDQDSSGDLSRAEFASFYFDLFDEDSDGEIDPGEWAAFGTP